MLKKLREARGKKSTAGDIGILLLHVVFVMYALYSAYHGINATASYRAVSGPWAIAGIIGIISVEFMLAGLYLAAMRHMIVGTAMMIAAGAAGALGLAITVLSIIGDSQMNAGLIPPPWLHTYLTTVLPAAPIIAAVGSFFVLWFSPWASRRRKEAAAEQNDAEDQHEMEMSIRQAERDAEYATKQVELDTKLAYAEQLNRYAKSEEVQGVIAATVAAKGPGMLRAAGLIVDVPHEPIQLPAPTHLSNNTQDGPTVYPLAQPTKPNGVPPAPIQGQGGEGRPND